MAGLLVKFGIRTANVMCKNKNVIIYGGVSLRQFDPTVRLLVSTIAILYAHNGNGSDIVPVHCGLDYMQYHVPYFVERVFLHYSSISKIKSEL